MAQKDIKPPIVDVNKLNQDLPDEYIASKIEREIGGVGAQYTVPFNTYAAFKAFVLNKGFDIDNYFGWQCWDGAALLWQQVGLTLVTGNGLAIGCWDLKRNTNKYDRFYLIATLAELIPGDVVCMRPNHIGFFDGFDGEYMRILGQNQGGVAGPNGGMAFNLARISKTAFAGAFRFKDWNNLTTGGDMNKDQATKLALYIRLLGFESVASANSHSADDVAHILADPGYAGAMAKEIKDNQWQTPAWKANNYDAEVAKRDATITDLQKQLAAQGKTVQPGTYLRVEKANVIEVK